MYLFMQVWDMRTKACIHTLTGHTNTVGTVFTQAPNPQAQILAQTKNNPSNQFTLTTGGDRQP